MLGRAEGQENPKRQNFDETLEAPDIHQNDVSTVGEQSLTVGFQSHGGADLIEWDALNELDFGMLPPQNSTPASGSWDMNTTGYEFVSGSFNHENIPKSPSPDLINFHSTHLSSISIPTNRPYLIPSQTRFPSLPATLSTNHMGRSFTPKTTIKACSQTNATILVQILKSYPKMMTKNETYPPFIHPFCVPDTTSGPSYTSSESLQNCRNLAKLFYSDTGGRRLVWRMIRMEQERMAQEVSNRLGATGT